MIAEKLSYKFRSLKISCLFEEIQSLKDLSRLFVMENLSRELTLWPRNVFNRSVIFARKMLGSFSTKMEGYLVIIAKNTVPSAKLRVRLSVINESLTRMLVRECARPRLSYIIITFMRLVVIARPSNVKVVGVCTNSEDYRSVSNEGTLRVISCTR
jgi:hypothetical protein